MPRGLLAFPLKGAAQVPGDELSPSEERKSLGGAWPPEARAGPATWRECCVSSAPMSGSLDWVTAVARDCKLPDICLCLLPERTWHKVNDPKVDYIGDLGEGKIGHETRLEPCWTMLVIGPLSAMWTGWAKLDVDLNLGPGTYACL